MVCSIADKAERENDSSVGSWGTTLRVWLERAGRWGSVWDLRDPSLRSG